MDTGDVAVGPISAAEYAANGGRMEFRCRAEEDLARGSPLRFGGDWTRARLWARDGSPPDAFAARDVAAGEIAVYAPGRVTADVTPAPPWPPNG